MRPPGVERHVGSATTPRAAGTPLRERRAAAPSPRERGQAVVLLVAALMAVGVGAFALGGVLRGVLREGEAQRAADLSALAGARAMHVGYPRLFEPPALDGRPNPRHLEKAAYLELGRTAARDVARRNGIPIIEVTFPDAASFAPTRIRVHATADVRAGSDRAAQTTVDAAAEAELAPPAADGLPAFAEGGGYDGALAYRQGKPMRPDVAQAFDRLAAVARRDGVTLLVNSGFRSDAEQAVLWARNPDPRMVAPPGRSLHRYGTELDLGPDAAYGWLARNAPRFGFILRYSWEPWHWGFSLNPRSTPRRVARAAASGARPMRGGGARDAGVGRGMPSFVPESFAPLFARAAQRWNVSATLLAAQAYAESNFNPFAVSSAGARGIAQFMPATARAYGLSNPHDPAQAIDAQAHLMRDLLRQFGSVPLALAAYNAGPRPVSACGCVPPLEETRGYVARILGLMGGAGDVVAGGGGLVVRLVA